MPRPNYPWLISWPAGALKKCRLVAGAAGWPISEPVTSWGTGRTECGESPLDKQPHMESASRVIAVEGPAQTPWAPAFIKHWNKEERRGQGELMGVEEPICSPMLGATGVAQDTESGGRGQCLLRVPVH